MARKSIAAPPEPFEERIVDVDVATEMRGSFLEYAYSVIYARAIPDARDGLKPVQRRILFQMSEMGLRPDRAHVKCARVVGDVMGRLHPHGDSAIYDALVRLSQSWVMRVPLVDGHGNFGSLDDGPAAYRYTECRLDTPAMLMTDSLDEDVVAMIPNYDGKELQPEVLPSAFPNLLVNGATGIAVGMATNMPPHNLGEVIAAARHLIAHPDATLDDLMRFVPGPDFPSGGVITGLAGIRDAYETGRGSFRTRAVATVEQAGRRKNIVVTELPYMVGPERMRERIADLVRSKKVQGVTDVEDYTDRMSGMRLVIEVKNGFVPEALLEHLYRLSPLEESCSINNVALVEGQPRTLGLKELLSVYVAHRLVVVRQRSEYRRRRREERLHLIDGLVVALLDIDEVIALIRASDDTAAARTRLMQVFELSEVQATYILDTPLRRLTKYDRLELETEAATLRAEIAALLAILEDDALLRRTVSEELADVARRHGTPRRTVLLESGGSAATPAAVAGAVEVVDAPCHVLLSSSGRLARTTGDDRLLDAGQRARHDVITSAVTTTARADIGLVTSAGRVIRVPALDLPVLPPTASTPSLAGGAPLADVVTLASDETVLCVTTLSPDSPGIALGTARGVVKRVTTAVPLTRDDWEVITLDAGDRVVGAVELLSGEEQLVFVTSDAQLLTFSAGLVRPQGRGGQGVAGIKVGNDAAVIHFGAVALGTPGCEDPVLLTVATSSMALPGTEVGTVKVTSLEEFPTQGRGGKGVRAHRFLKGEDGLTLAWAGPAPVRAAAADGSPVPLPEARAKRDASGVALAAVIVGVAGPPLR